MTWEQPLWRKGWSQGLGSSHAGPDLSRSVRRMPPKVQQRGETTQCWWCSVCACVCEGSGCTHMGGAGHSRPTTVWLDARLLCSQPCLRRGHSGFGCVPATLRLPGVILHRQRSLPAYHTANPTGDRNDSAPALCGRRDWAALGVPGPQCCG